VNGYAFHRQKVRGFNDMNSDPVDDSVENVNTLHSPIQLAFPIFGARMFETEIGSYGCEIGILKSYPSELRMRLTAAILSYAGGLSSMDYALKRYVNVPDFPNYDLENENRIDSKIMSRCLSELECHFDLMSKSVDEKTDPEQSIGAVIGYSTLVRVPFSMERAFAEANRGALYEAVVISRMILEQLAWICAVSSIHTADEVKRVKVTSSVTSLKKIVPMSGRLYGWLSGHAHWSFDAHIKAFDFSGDIAKTRLADSSFKATAYGMLILLTSVICQVLRILRSEDLRADRLAEARMKKYLIDEFNDRDLLMQVGRVDGVERDLVDLYKILNG
jgi:hypothetical protein